MKLTPTQHTLLSPWGHFCQAQCCIDSYQIDYLYIQAAKIGCSSILNSVRLHAHLSQITAIVRLC